MKHLMNTKTEKLTRRGFAFLLALVLMTSAFVPGLTARAVEDTTDPSVMLLGGDGLDETQPETPTGETTTPTEETTAPTVETTAPTEETTAPTEETTAPTEEATVPTEGDDEIPEEDSNGAIEEIPDVDETFVRMTKSAPVARSATEITSPIFSKTATLRDDGNYDLKVSISGAFAQESNPALVDIVLIVDRSGSMIENNVTINGKTMTRFANAISAAKSLVNAVAGNSNINARYNILTFAGKITTADGYKAISPYVTASGWMTTKDSAISTINSIPTPIAGDATNYEAAFVQLNKVSYRTNASKIVIFLTDGDPTIRVTNEDNTASKRNNKGYNLDVSEHYFGSGMTNANNVAACLATAKTQIAKISMDRFYAIGTGTSKSSNLTALGNAATKASYVQVKTTSDSNLTKIFNDIAQEITSFYCENVTVVDQLKHIDGQLVVDVVDPSKAYVTVYNNGGVIKSGEDSVTLDATADNKQATITATYDSVNHQMILDFPDDYKLEKTYTYEISMVIKATEKAYREYREKLKYVDRGELETGTHSDQLGIQCNDWAKATYTYIDQPITAEYHYPVIQLLPGTLVVGKSFDGLTEEQIASIEDLVFDVTLTYPDDGNGVDDETVTEQIPFSAMEKGEDGIYTYAIYGLSPKTKYSVTESGGTVKDYDQETSVSVDGAESVVSKTVTGTVESNSKVAVTYTNAYEIAITEITVEKQVEGNLGDWGKPFGFTASIAGITDTMDGIQYIKYGRDGNVIEEVTVSGKEASFTLMDDEYVTFTNVPLRSTLTVSENPENYEMSVTGDGVTKNGNSAVLNVTDKTTITFTNKLEATIETGIALDSIPYIVILAGVAAAVAFLFLRKRRVEE